MEARGELPRREEGRVRSYHILELREAHDLVVEARAALRGVPRADAAEAACPEGFGQPQSGERRHDARARLRDWRATYEEGLPDALGLGRRGQAGEGVGRVVGDGEVLSDEVGRAREVLLVAEARREQKVDAVEHELGAVLVREAVGVHVDGVAGVHLLCDRPPQLGRL